MISHASRSPGPDEVLSYQRVERTEAIPSREDGAIDVAVLDMNHDWPNVGHDALVGAVRAAALEFRAALEADGLKIRVLSFDVRKHGALPASGDRYRLVLGTGGPGQLDPRLNDGISPASQGIAEDPFWELPLYHLFDAIADDEETALIGVCHTFGLLCRWSGAATPRLRGLEKGGKSSGLMPNVLTREALAHPWFSRFADALPDHRHLTVIDNRLFDLIPEANGSRTFTPIGFECNKDGSAADAITMIEFAREREGIMPRIFAVNHHPEIVDRDHILGVLRQKYARGEVTQQWFEERAGTLVRDFVGESERMSRLTSEYTLLAPVRYHLARIIAARREELGLPARFDMSRVLESSRVA